MPRGFASRGWLLAAAVALWAAMLAPAAARADPASARVDELVKALGDSSYKVRTQAALVLGKLRDPRAFAPLGHALTDDNETVRAVAAMALARLGDARARPLLEGMRGDPSSFVRTSVDKALAQLTTPGAGPQGGAGGRHYVAVRVVGAPLAGAAERLERALAAELTQLPNVTADLPGAAAAGAQRTAAWALDCTITNLRVSGGQLDCDVSVTIAALPSHSIKATASAGASVSGVRAVDDVPAQQDCLAGAAQQISTIFVKFLALEGGRGTR